MATKKTTTARTAKTWSGYERDGQRAEERLTAFQVVEQSWRCHPDWDAEAHLAYLAQEGYDPAELHAADPAAFIAYRIAQLASRPGPR